MQPSRETVQQATIGLVLGMVLGFILVLFFHVLRTAYQ